MKPSMLSKCLVTSIFVMPSMKTRSRCPFSEICPRTTRQEGSARAADREQFMCSAAVRTSSHYSTSGVMVRS